MKPNYRVKYKELRNDILYQLRKEGEKSLEEPFYCETYPGWKVEGFNPKKGVAILYYEDDDGDGGVGGLKKVDQEDLSLFDLICIQEQKG